MTPKAKRPAHAGLETHREQVRSAVEAYNRAERAEQEAHATLEAARNKVREAADLGLDATEALAELTRAKQHAEQCALAREGITVRVRRAEQARDLYMSENGYALIAERRDRGQEITDEMRACAETLIDLARQWREESTVIGSYLRALNLAPATTHRAHTGWSL